MAARLIHRSTGRRRADLATSIDTRWSELWFSNGDQVTVAHTTHGCGCGTLAAVNVPRDPRRSHVMHFRSVSCPQHA